jgi:hypothetical protein
MLVQVLSGSPRNLSWQVNWPAAMESGHVLKEITYLCRTFFGVEMVLIGRRLP